MPALRQAEMVSTERDLGPSVPTILVIAGKKLCSRPDRDPPDTEREKKKASQFSVEVGRVRRPIPPESATKRI